MKPLILFLTSIGAGAVLAQSQFQSELEQLTAQRDKALATAADPIDRKYREALEALLKKAMQASELDGALKIREALEAAGPSAAGNGDPFGDDIAPMIEGTKWLWPIEFAANTPESIRWISFEPDKVVRHGWYPQSATWRLVKPGVIELTQHGKEEFVWTVEFSSDYKRATVIQMKSRKREQMRLISK
ncbi:MAG: hypothetical protein EOP87_08620 [Verrucomicrobiaceae bacterium]|nr:MAG: hypothetical protein EOP87_08620 [Verrucomicrobiaceae bacterium]